MNTGSLFAGYRGLTLFTEEIFNAKLEACSEFNEAPRPVMAHHWPGVPHLGDTTQVDLVEVNREHGELSLCSTATHHAKTCLLQGLVEIAPRT